MTNIVCPNCEWEGSEDDLILGKCPDCHELTSACPNCGERVGANDSFCWNCGQELNREDTPIKYTLLEETLNRGFDTI